MNNFESAKIDINFDIQNTIFAKIFKFINNTAFKAKIYENMLEISVIRENREGVLAGLKKKNVSQDQLELIDKIIVEDDNRKSTQTSLDNLLSKINKISEEIGGLYKTGKTDDANAMKQTVATLKEETKTLESALKDSKDLLEEMIIQLPNLPHASVPVGKRAEDNEIFKAWDGPMPVLVEGSLPHWELAEKYNLISFKDGVTLTGSGFPVYKGKGARLQRALI
ncbi:MAG: hypothetical protein KBF57_14375, partial [Saprospiraceae bacterium]|nr:hypothetical protein [Saprospiraceae bacterium]